MELSSFLLLRRRWAVILIQINLLLVTGITAQQSNGPSGNTNGEGFCSMYGICGKRTDGKVLNCANTTRAVKPDELLSSKIQSLCPTISGDICCTSDQFDTLRSQVQQAIPFLVGCPACLRNFLNLYCEMSCSPNQSQFINVTSINTANGTKLVGAINFFVTSEYGEKLYDSCKEVKFGTMNTRAMDFIGAGAHNYKEWFAFMGKLAPPNAPGSPFGITYRTDGLRPLNSTVYSCGDTSLGCSCGDCPSNTVCLTSGEQVKDHTQKRCAVNMGSLRPRCLDFSLAVAFIVILATFLALGFFKERSLKSKRTFNAENHDHKDLASDESAVETQEPSIVQKYMSNLFRKLGIFITRNAVIVLVVSVAIPVLLSIGLIRLNVETRPAKLWVSPGSKMADEKKYFDTNLAPFYRIEELIIANTSTGGTVMTEDNIRLLFQIQKKVDKLRANYAGKPVALTDICLNPLGTACAVQSILQYFQMDPQAYTTYVDHANYCFQHFSSEISCLSKFQAPIDPSVVLGGFSENNYAQASAFIITYPVNNQVDENGDDYKKAVAWEEAFITLAKEEIIPMVQKQGLSLSFSSENSVQKELTRESSADAITIAISYIVMFIYISFMLGDIPRSSSFFISTKVLLGLSGVILVILSVVASIGLFSAAGVKSTLIIMEVIPFLVLAVGVDNMCILVHAVKRQVADESLEMRMSNALSEVGPSITLASLAEVFAFAAGTFTPMPAVRVFSMFASLAILFDFLLQVTAFVALIVLDSKRAESGRIDCFPCVKLASTQGALEGKPSLLQRYMKEYHAPVLSNKIVKVIVIAVFLGFAFISIALSARLEPGLEQQIVLPRDSYLQGYFDDLAKYLRVGPPLYFVAKNFNYSSDSNQTDQICSINQCNSNSLLNEISKASLDPKNSFIAKPAASWLDDFLNWLSPDAFSCCRKFTNQNYCPPDDQAPCCEMEQGTCTTSTGTCNNCTTCFLRSELQNGRPSTKQFKEKLPWFLNALPSQDCAKGGKGAYTTNLNLTGFESGLIRASAFRTYHTPLNKQTDYVDSLRAARDFSTKMSEALQMEIFPYSVFYIFFEQYLNIWKTALINIALGLGVVFIVCLIVTGSLWTSAIILLVLIMIIVDLMGVMGILKIQLNALSVVNLVMSIGIAVEFCVHITHAFTVSIGNRDTRMKESLYTMGSSVFSGITLTKLVGVIVLRFAKSKVFVVYYFQMYLALVLIGFLHGLVFLPVLLSLIGPPSRRKLQN